LAAVEKQMNTVWNYIQPLRPLLVNTEESKEITIYKWLLKVNRKI